MNVWQIEMESIDGIVAAFYHSQDIRICGFCIPGIYVHRDHKCGKRAGEGTAGDREGQVFQIGMPRAGVV